MVEVISYKEREVVNDGWLMKISRKEDGWKGRASKKKAGNSPALLDTMKPRRRRQGGI